MMLKYLIQKEFLQIRRNKFLPRLIVMFPIMMMCVMPWVMSHEVKNVRVDVVDNDHSAFSRRLIHDIKAGGSFVLNAQRDTYSAALSDVERMDADVVVVIPEHFSRDMELGLGPQVLVAANAVNGTKGAMGSAWLSQTVTEHVSPTSCTPGQVVSVLYMYNKRLNYKVFMIPALFAIIMMLICGFLPTLNIVGEKEAGTIEQINVTPVGKATFILGKLIPYWIIAMFVIMVCLVLSWLLYGITCRGPLWLVFLLAMLLALFWSSFGLVISNHSDTMQQAVFVMWFFVVCMLLLSGLLTPSQSMPYYARLTTYVNPMHYFVDAIRTVFVRGGELQSVARQMLALLALSSVMAVWAVTSYKKNS